MEIFILGLEKKFRGLGLLNSIESQGHEAQVVWGEDAEFSQIKIGILRRMISKVVNGRDLTLGEICCSYGHRSIMSLFIESGHEWALIFEEDARLVKQIHEIESLASGRKGPTIVHLGGLWKSSLSSPEETFWVKRLNLETHLNQQVQVISVIGNVFGAYGYLINREAALIAIRRNSNLRFPQLADWPSTWTREVEFLLTDEPYVSVELESSNLESSRKYMLKENYVSRFAIWKKLLGWLKIFANVVLVVPLFKKMFGVSFRSTLYNNLYIYSFQRLLVRLRFQPLEVEEEE